MRSQPALLRLLLFTWALLIGCTALRAEGRRMEVLFLGSDGGHQPAERYSWLYRVVGPQGINLTYTASLADLNDATLGHYDVVAIYANQGALPVASEAALLRFVRGGHGLVGLHCASACFGNSAEYRRLLGGRFVRHEGAVFTPVTVDAEHEITKGLPALTAWDETYVHDALNPDLHLLQKRGEEPWTWVRAEGAGRVFYTASGHDARVWSQPAFQQLVERAIRWAAGPQAVAELTALQLQPLEYYDGPPVQNYEHRTPPPRAQRPLSPDEAAKHIHVPADLRLSLVASEPDLWKTLDIKFDERGRMWTCETRDFPNDLKKQGEGGDRIRIWESTRGDGQFDKVSVFATGLSIPCSVLPWRDGALVLTMPDTLFLRDTDGDGVADERTVLFTGWGTGDTHFGPSHLTYGFDGWIYGSIGADSFRGTVGGEKVEFRANALFRFRPDGSKLERLAKVSNNIWGFAFNEDGDIFGSTANNQSSVYLPIPERYYNATPGLELGTLPGVDANKKAPYMREYIRQVDVQGGFTSASSHMFYTARAFPAWYWNRVAFINEPTAHIVYRGVAERQGADFRVENGWNLLASDDEWFAPVFSTVGPDGAVYVSDFYSFIMQHGPPPRKETAGFDAPLGKGGAFLSPLRSTDRARIWRVAAPGAAGVSFRLSRDEPQPLLAALRSDNLFWRQQAQRLLVERGSTDVAPQLRALVADRAVDAAGVNGGALHALWTLHLLAADDLATIESALHHPASGVRRAAADVMPRTAEGARRLLESGALRDADERVRLHALLALSEMPASDEAGGALYALAGDHVVLSDRWLPDALTIAASRHGAGFLAAALKDAQSPLGAAPRELAPDPGFEGPEQGAWKPRTYHGHAEFTLDPHEAHTGRASLRISSTEGADASWQARIAVEPNNEYRLEGWIKCRDLQKPGPGGRGALVNVQDLPVQTEFVIGSKEWTKVSCSFNSGDHSEIEVNLLFGGWGLCTGTAWWDDLSLTRIDQTSREAGILRGVATAFAATAAPEQLHPIHELLASKTPVAELIAGALFPPSPKPRGPAGDNDPTHWAIDLRRHEPVAVLRFIGTLKEIAPGVFETGPGEGRGAWIRVTGRPGAGSPLKFTSRSLKLKRESLDPRCGQEVSRTISGTFQSLTAEEQLQRARRRWQEAEAIMQAAYARAQVEVAKAGRVRLSRLQRERLDEREDWAGWATHGAGPPEQQVAYWEIMLEYTLDQIEFLKVYSGRAVPGGVSGRYRALDRGWLDLQETPKGLKFRLTTLDGYTARSRKPGDLAGLAHWRGSRATYWQPHPPIGLILTRSTGHRIHLESEGMEGLGGAGAPYEADFYKLRNLARPIDLAYRPPWD